MLEETDTFDKSLHDFEIYLAKMLSPNTVRNYIRGLKHFQEYLLNIGIDTSKLELLELSEAWVSEFINQISHLSSSTQKVYLTGICKFFEFINKYSELDIDTEIVRKIRGSIRKEAAARARYKPPLESVRRLINYVQQIQPKDDLNERSNLRILRDKSIILLLADTNIELRTINKLNRSDILWSADIASLQIPDKDKSVLLTRRSSSTLKEYLEARKQLDDSSSLPISSIPIFSRHDRGASDSVLPISTMTIRNLIKGRAVEVLGRTLGSTISARDLQSYSVVSSLIDHIKTLHPKIQRRCKTAFESGLYDDSIFNAMKVIESEVREKTSLGHTAIGVNLITNALKPDSPEITFSPIQSEQEAAFFLYRGAIGLLKNPHSHRFIDTSDPVKTIEILSFASLLLRMLDEVT